MKLSRRVIRRYLTMVTEAGPAAALTDPVQNLAAFDDAIDAMADAARAAGDEDILRIAIDALVSEPRGRAIHFVGDYYPWPNDEFAELLGYTFSRIWPQESLSFPGSEPDVEFADMTDEEWGDYTGKA
jgi:hypothetical protein